MKNKILYIIMIALAMTVMIGLAEAASQPGGVQACDINGDDEHLTPGTLIYYKSNGNLVGSSSTSWEIYDKDVTCPPETVTPEIGCAKLLKSGSGGSTNPDGSISPPIATTWSIPSDDYPGHHYRLIVTIGPNAGNYEEFYTKNDSFEPVPELNPMLLTSAGLLGIVLVSRKYRSK